MELMCNILPTTSVTMIRGRCDGKSLLKKDTTPRSYSLKINNYKIKNYIYRVIH